MRFVHLDPPGLIRSREIAEKGAAACSGGLEDGSLDQNASCCILPERDQQLARQSNDHRFAKTAARALTWAFRSQVHDYGIMGASFGGCSGSKV